MNNKQHLIFTTTKTILLPLRILAFLGGIYIYKNIENEHIIKVVETIHRSGYAYRSDK